MSVCVSVPDAAVDDVREQLRQGGLVREVAFFVVRVDCTLCVPVPALLLLSQLVVVELHGC